MPPALRGARRTARTMSAASGCWAPISASADAGPGVVAGATIGDEESVAALFLGADRVIDY